MPIAGGVLAERTTNGSARRARTAAGSPASRWICRALAVSIAVTLLASSALAQETVEAEEVFPSSGGSSEPEPEPDPELTEDFVLPPPELEWRLRLGVGASASTSGTDVLSLRLTQEIEWMPTEAAPFLFGITGGELIGSINLYLAGIRLGGYARFCEDRIVVCTGAISIRGGAIFGAPGGVAFDLGGDGDVRFRFDGVELGLRVGFFVAGGNTFVDALALLGAAF